MADGLFAKTGKDSINIAGHKIPIALLAGVGALAMVVVVLRARSQGQNVAQVGTQATTTAADTGFGWGSMAPDYSAALANISTQLASLQSGTGTSGTAVATPSASGPVAALLSGGDPSSLYAWVAGKGWQTGEPVWGPQGNAAAALAVVPVGSVLQEIGVPNQFGPGQEVVLPGGQIGFVNPTQIGGTAPLTSNPSINH